METAVPSLMYRQFMRGLSDGILVLAIAGVFWFGLAAWSADCARVGALPWANGDVPVHYLLWEPWPALMITGWIVYGAICVRRKARGFRYSEIRNASESHRKLSRRIVRTFVLVGIGEGALCGLSAYFGVRFHREDLIWPAIGAAVSIHFLPLGSIFRVRPYYVTGVSGAIISCIALLAPHALFGASGRWIFAGVGMGATMWVTAAYLILRSDRHETAWDAEPEFTSGSA